jgi:hypothetical protein
MAGAGQRQRQVLRALEAVAPGDRRQVEDRREKTLLIVIPGLSGSR